MTITIKKVFSTRENAKLFSAKKLDRQRIMYWNVRVGGKFPQEWQIGSMGHNFG